MDQYQIGGENDFSSALESSERQKIDRDIEGPLDTPELRNTKVNTREIGATGVMAGEMGRFGEAGLPSETGSDGREEKSDLPDREKQEEDDSAKERDYEGSTLVIPGTENTLDTAVELNNDVLSDKVVKQMTSEISKLDKKPYQKYELWKKLMVDSLKKSYNREFGKEIKGGSKAA